MLIFFRPSPRRRLRQPDSFQRLRGGDWDQLVEHFFTEHLINPLAISLDGRSNKNGVGGGMHFKVLVRMGERVMRDEAGNVKTFGRLGFEEFASRRDVEEQVPDLELGAARKGDVGRPNFTPRRALAMLAEESAPPRTGSDQ